MKINNFAALNNITNSVLPQGDVLHFPQGRFAPWASVPL